MGLQIQETLEHGHSERKALCAPSQVGLEESLCFTAAARSSQKIEKDEAPVLDSVDSEQALWLAHVDARTKDDLC